MDLLQLQQCLRKKDFTQALTYLFEHLNQIEFGDECLLSEYLELADCVYACFCDPKCEITDHTFYALLIHQHKIRDLLLLRGSSAADNLLHITAKQLKHKTGSSNASYLQALKRYYLCFDWDRKPVYPWQHLALVQPSWFLAFAMSALAHQTIINKKQMQQIMHLEKQLTHMTLPPLPEHCVPLLVRAWYQTLYRVTPDAFQTRTFLNQLLRSWLNTVVKPQPLCGNDEDKKTILIVLEYFTSHHALYRCYAPMIQQLSNQFHCVALCASDRIDEEGRRLFSDVIEPLWRVPSDIQHTVTKIKALAPSLIFYPSLGMHTFAVCLANLRLAPIQVMAPGQAVSSAHALVDHLLIYSEFYHPNALRSEKVVVLPENHYRFVLPEKALAEPFVADKQHDKVHIIVPATHYKLNAEFLERCVRIKEKSRLAIQFHFTPYSTGLQYYAHRQAIQQYIPDAIVHPAYDYEEYVKVIASCDMALMTVPFGGSNSSVDLCALAIPFVCQIGVEPFSRVDATLSSLMQLPDWLRTHNSKSYCDAAARLIEDKALRMELSLLMRANQYQFRLVCGESSEEYVTAFSDLLSVKVMEPSLDAAHFAEHPSSNQAS